MLLHNHNRIINPEICKIHCIFLYYNVFYSIRKVYDYKDIDKRCFKVVSENGLMDYYISHPATFIIGLIDVYFWVLMVRKKYKKYLLIECIITNC